MAVHGVPPAPHRRRHRGLRDAVRDAAHHLHIHRSSRLAELTVPAALTPTVDAVLARARTRLRRLTPEECAVLLAGDEIVLVDTRTAAQRAAGGAVPGALIVDRNVLEWRFDPASASRLAMASYDLPVVVMCAQGFSSSLAAASLQELGIHRATDVVGGFEAWQAAGLPVDRPPARSTAF